MGYAVPFSYTKKAHWIDPAAELAPNAGKGASQIVIENLPSRNG